MKKMITNLNFGSGNVLVALLFLLGMTSFNGAQGQEPAPENDEPCFAFEAVCGETYEGSTANATGSGAPAGFCGTSPGAQGVWYILEGDDQQVTANTFGSDYDTKINVYTGACVLLECVTGNDDTNGLQSQVTFDALGGNSYWIYVNGFGSANGNYVLNISCEDLPEPVENDACENASPVACGDIIEGTTAGATSDGAPFCGTSNTAPGVWYALSVEANSNVSASLCGSSYDTKLSVYTGSCDELECVGGNDDACGLQSEVDFEAEPGIEYLILVHGFSSAAGDFVLSLSCEEIFECPEQEANIGDPCDDQNDQTENDMITEECGCEGTPIEELSDCENYEYYLADILADGTTNIYEVSLVGSDAVLELKGTSEIEVHIALNEANGLIYAVSKADGSFRTFDPATGTFGPVEMLDTEVSEIVGATFNADGKLMILSQSENAIYSVTLGSNEVSIFDSYSPVLGGDIDFSADGALYLATREGFGTLYLAIPNEVASDILIGDAPQFVTGLADIEGEGSFLLSHRDALTLEVLAYDGTPGTPYDVVLGGEPFMTFNGDLASGCADNRQPSGDDCENFRIFYANHGSGISGTDIYGVEIVGGNAEMTLLTNVGFEAHIAYDGDNDLLYLVNANGSFVRAYDPSGDSFEGDLPIDGNIGSLYAVVYNPGDGLLYVGDANADEIFTIDLVSGLATYFADGNIQGGDLALQDGTLYLASRSGNSLFEIVGGSGSQVGNVPANVNGLAAANNATDLLSSHFGAPEFYLLGADGSVLDTYPALLGGEPFTLNNGDLASACADNSIVTSSNDCDYKLYYSHQPQGGQYNLIEVTLNNDGTASYNELLANGGGHIGLSPDGSSIYILGGNNVKTYDVALGSIVNNVNIETAEGQNLSGFPAAVVDDNGVLYGGDGNAEKIYTIDPVTGIATLYAEDIIISGGDLIIVDGELWVVNRGQNKFTKVSDGTVINVDVTQMNGAAVLPNGNVLVADGNQESLLKEIDLSIPGVVATYDIGLPLFNGDLAGRCVSGDDVQVCEPLGACYATIAEYVEGTTQNGGSIAANRANADNAIGEPERVDALVFTTLGYGGSLTFQFDGVVPNNEGDDLEIVEVSYGNPGCEAYPEYADVSVSQDGENFFFIGTVCKSNAFVDISNAEGVSLDCVSYVRVSNNDELSSSPDGFDVDGIVNLHACEEADEEENGDDGAQGIEIASQNEISSLPNPTTGPSTVVFVNAETSVALVEVYDMSGRVVETLFNQVANAGQEYRIDFNGSDLPNGVYIYRMTTDKETIMTKFMVAR